MFELTAFQRDVLFVVNGLDSPHGLAIKEELGRYYNEDINHGRLYPNLNELANMGLIDIGQKDDRTNEYTVTDDGIEKLENRLNWESEYTK